MNRFPQAFFILFAAALCWTPDAVAANLNVAYTFSSGKVGQVYSDQLKLFTGTGPFTFTLSSGALPPGLSLASSTGAVSGTPTYAGTFTFGLNVSDSQGNSGSGSYSIQIAGNQLLLTPGTLAPAGARSPYGPVQLAVSGGVPPYTLEFTSNNLPAGMTFSASTWTIAGTPQAEGGAELSFKATDSQGSIGVFGLTLQVRDIGPSFFPPGMKGQPFSQNLDAPGTVSIIAGSLPPGLSLSGQTISGTPTVGGTFNFTVRSTSPGLTIERAMSILIETPTFRILTETLPPGLVQYPYASGILADVISPPLTYTKTGGTLPPGLTLSQTGLVSGTPTAVGTFSFTVHAVDAAGREGDGTIALEIKAAFITLGPAGIPEGSEGQFYTVTFTATGGTPPYNFSIPTLPPGLSLNAATGVLSGTPTTPGGAFLNVSVTDSGGASASIIVAINIRAVGSLAINPASLPNATVSVEYSQNVMAVGAPTLTGVAAWGIYDGSLPPGLKGTQQPGNIYEIRGTPTDPGVYPFRLTATDSVNRTASMNYSITVSLPAISVSPSSLPTGQATIPYSTQFTASGGTPPYTYSVTNEIGGPTISQYISPSGLLSFTPDAPGTSSFTIRATDSTGQFGFRAYALTVTAGPVSIETASLPAGVIGNPYYATLSGISGSPPYTFSITGGALPPGLQLSSSTISGTPQETGLFSFRVTITDQKGGTASRNYQLTIASTGISLGPDSLPDAFGGQPYLAQLTASGGQAPYTFAMPSGVSWAAGMSVQADGKIVGTPPEGLSTTLQFTIRATDAVGSTATREFQIHLRSGEVELSVLPATLPNAKVGQLYSVTFTTSGGQAPYSYSVTGNLPAGLTFDAAGTLSGTPTVNGPFQIQLRVEDANGVVANLMRALAVGALPPLKFETSALPQGNVQQPYSASFQASGGTGPYLFQLAGGALPSGFTLSPSGVLAGTSSEGATYTLLVRVSDEAGTSVQQTFFLVMLGTPVQLVLDPAELPDATLEEPYLVQMSASGGTPPYIFHFSGVPADLNSNEVGRIYGIPRGQPRTVQLQVRVTDATLAKLERTVPLRLVAGAIQVTPASLPSGLVGSPYAVTFAASGGQAPYTFSIVPGGSVPAGLTLTPAGVLSGTFTENRTGILPLKVQDANGLTAVREYWISVNLPPVVVPLSVIPDYLPPATVGQAYQWKFVAAGGKPPYTFGFLGTPPGGLQFASNGTLSGMAVAPGSHEITIQVSDSAGASAQHPFPFRINAPGGALYIQSHSLPPSQQGEMYSGHLGAGGGTPPYTFGLAGGALPGTVQLLTDGSLSGIPDTPGSFSFTAKVTDGAGAQASAVFDVAVLASATVNNLVVDPPQLQFSLDSGAQSAPRQCVALVSTLSATPVNAFLSGADPGWVRLSSNAVDTPGFICVEAALGSRSAGVYRADLNLAGLGVTPGILSVPLTLNINAASGGLLLSPLQVHATSTQGSAAQIHSLVLTNDGSAAAHFSAQTNASWATVDPPNGTIPAFGTQILNVRIDLAGLQSGVYTSRIQVLTNGGDLSGSMDLVVTPAPGRLALSQQALELVAWTGGIVVSGQIGVINHGTIPLSPTITVETETNEDWLQAVLGGTTLAPGSATNLDIAPNPASLAPGRYTGSVRVEALNGSNGPQAVSIGLTVLAPNAPLPPEVGVSGVVLTPARLQTSIALALPPVGNLTFTTAILGTTSNWLTVSPSTGTVGAGGLLTLSFSANAAGLKAGLHTALVALGLSDGTVRVVPVSLFVPTPLATGSAITNPVRMAIPNCGPLDRIMARILSPTPNFTARSLRPVTARVYLQQCDGSPVDAPQISLQVGAGEVRLQPESPYIWSATWIPEEPTDRQQLLFAITAGGSSAVLQVEGKVAAGTLRDPAVKAVVPTANPTLNTPVVPGGWISIFGENLAAETIIASGASLPNEIGNVSLTLGGKPLFIYYVSQTQINALAPQSLMADTRLQLLVRRNGVLGVPVEVPVAAAAPGLFTLNQQGTGQAAALLAGTATLVAPATPAARGSVVELYGSGFGPVSNPPADGEKASLTTLSHVVTPVQATIDGKPAQILFAGLTPGAVGLYQINLLIPEDAAIGDQVEVVLRQGNVSSNPVTIAIR